MTITINGTTGITNDGGYTGDGVVFADTTPANTLVTDTSGNVGIGTSSPGAKIDVFASSQPVIRLTSGEDFVAGGTANPFGALQFFTTDPSGAGARVVGSVQTIADTSSTAPGGVMVLSTAAVNAVATERARIDSSGNLLVGISTYATTPASGVTVQTGNNASVNVGHTNSSSGFLFVNFGYNSGQIGSITQNGTTAVAYNTTSDYRLKENVQPLSGALARVAALKPCTYTWKSAPDEIGEGFIAHELAEVCPQAVTGEKDAVNEDGSIKPQSIDTSFLVATLTAAIQEQQAIILAQESALNALTARVAALDARLTSLEGTQP